MTLPDPNPAALAFMKSRRSRPAKILTTPVPSREEIEELLTVAARTPDHGKLEPWRFIVFEKAALTRLSETIAPKGQTLGIEEEKIGKSVVQLADADLAIAVISSPKPSEKIPEVEQVLSAGAVTMQLLSAALAAGWGANWLSGWFSHDKEWREEHLGLEAHESIVGFVHIGTERMAPPERPRPDLSAITSWVSE